MIIEKLHHRRKKLSKRPMPKKGIFQIVKKKNDFTVFEFHKIHEFYHLFDSLTILSASSIQPK